MVYRSPVSTADSLRWIFSDCQEPPESPYFGESFLWTALFRKS
ncbi:hypothetical protein [Streptomyces sp. NBC_01262]|nr:hypothetical protein [Streptomyces sp. NBC_01262]